MTAQATSRPESNRVAVGSMGLLGDVLPGQKFRFPHRKEGAPVYEMLSRGSWKAGMQVRRTWPDGCSDEVTLSKKYLREEVIFIQPNDKVSDGGPLTPESKQDANPPFAAPLG